MSEEKIDAVDRRITELVNITGNLVKAVNQLAEQQNKFAEQQNKFAEQQNKFADEQQRLAEEQQRLAGQQILTTNRLDDVIRIVHEQNKQHEEFRKETNKNFTTLREENKIINRKVEWSTTTSLDADKRVKALEIRVAKLEEKIAA